MTDEVRSAMAAAIQHAPHNKIAAQLQSLLDRLEATGGTVNTLIPQP